MYGISSDFLDRRVVLYARVSTEHEAQLAALENQVDWYKPILAARPKWQLVGCYIDEGITGTSAEKRPQFMQMIRDAKAKKFDMILTREVSRFARNTVDTLQYTRALKDYGVEVFFINDNIKTFDGDGELRLTIMATLAQDESRKTSIRVKSGQQTSMEKGVVYGNGNILGYDRVGKEMVINPEQAETVRMIFDMYLNGMGMATIQYELERLGRKTASGKEKWFATVISQILRNSFYCGIMTYHKEYTPDYLKQRKIANKGVLEYVQVKGNHTPIVTVEEFERVQQIRASRSRKVKDGEAPGGRRPQSSMWGRLLICQCGKKFNQHKINRVGRATGADYICYTSINQGSIQSRLNKGLSAENCCDSPLVQSWKLEFMAKAIFSRYISNGDKVVQLAYMMLQRHIEDREDIVDYSEIVRKKRAEIDRLNQKKTNLIEMREDGDIDKNYFRERKQEIDERISALSAEIQNLSPTPVEEKTVDYAAKLKRLRSRLAEYADFNTKVIQEEVVEAFIEKIWVSKDEFRWYLRTDDAEKDDAERIKIAEFTLNLDQAKKYQYSFSTKKRIYNWTDLHISVWL